jgi:hypothetical protein
MKNTWGGYVAPFPHLFWRDPDTGAVHLMFARWHLNGNPKLMLRLIAEADGPVHTAHLYPYSDSFKCQYLGDDLFDGRYLMAALTQTGPIAVDGGAAEEHGAIGGSIDAPNPSVLLRVKELSNWKISSKWLAQLTLGWVKAWSWDAKTSAPVYESSNDPDGLQPHVPLVRGSEVFVPVGDLHLCGVMSWNPQDGVRPLLRWYGDQTRAAGNFGTDGKDMVWTQSQGAGACLNDGPNPEVWTAPYTTDPAVLKTTAHRVRSDLGGMSPDPFAVGLGYAARYGQYGSPPAVSISIIRLSDGNRWILPGETGTQPLHWGSPMGFTDQELFVFGGTADMPQTIFRIRLDSLGPGTPPD